MAFIKVGNTVINTSQIAVVELNRVSEDGISCVVIVMAATEGSFQVDKSDWKSKEYWFSGEEAEKLRAYFSEPNYAIDLLQPPPHTAPVDIWESPSPYASHRPRGPRGRVRQPLEPLPRQRPSTFADYTETAIKVIMLSDAEARRLGHTYVGTEQILLGLVGEGTGVAAQVLKSLGVNLADARMEVEKIIGRGSEVVSNPIMRLIPRPMRLLVAKITGLGSRVGSNPEIEYTPRARRVLEFSAAEASQLGFYFIDTEHLLLGLLREQESVAARVLENLGVDLLQVRTEVLRRVSS